MTWFFVSDLHGRVGRYRALLAAIVRERPRAVLLGGDLLPHGLDRRWASGRQSGEFLDRYLLPQVVSLRDAMGASFPTVVVILGNDDERLHEPALERAETAGLLVHCHGRIVEVGAVPVLGYACVPPTPFALKDWERYDVSRYVDPGCFGPEEGRHTVEVDADELRHGTIAADLERIAGDRDLTGAIVLAHSPPHRCALDRAGLDGLEVDGVPLDPHVGSIALRRFLEDRRPAAGLHGHVHESARITGAWRDRVGETPVFTAAHDGPELALVRLDPADPETATRELIPVEGE